MEISKLRTLVSNGTDLRSLGISDEEVTQLQLLLNPVRWAETFLKNPDNPNEPLDVRWYQREMINYDGPRKVYRCGRQIGKTVALAIEALWYAFTHSYKNILIVCPYKSQVDVVWTQINKLVADSEILKESIVKVRSNPYYIEFANESAIRGFTAGTKAGQKAGSVRGQNGHLVIMDELDYMGDEAINTINALMHSKEDTRFIVSSTPTGQRQAFYDYCTNEKLGWKQFHFPSSVSPNWISIADAKTKDIPMQLCTEYLYRATHTEAEYKHEYEADFGEEEVGVFPAGHLDQCLRPYEYEDWQNVIFKEDTEEVVSKVYHKGCLNYYNPGNNYIMGVDWNRPENGVHIVIVEYLNEVPTNVPHEEFWAKCAGKYRVFWREEINIKDMTQHHAVQRIVALNKLIDPDYIYVDEGYGDVQIEMLRKIAQKSGHPSTKALVDRVKGVNASSKIPVFDPVTGRKIEKPAKVFIVNNAVRIVEDHRIVLPEFEDEKRMMVAQMREYRVKKRNDDGRPIYEGEDHIIDALMFALFGFTQNFSDLSYRQKVSEMAYQNSPLLQRATDAGIESRWTDPSQARLRDLPVGTFAPARQGMFEQSVGGMSEHHTYTRRSDHAKQEEEAESFAPQHGGTTNIGFIKTPVRHMTRRRLTSGSAGRRSTF